MDSRDFAAAVVATLVAAMLAAPMAYGAAAERTACAARTGQAAAKAAGFTLPRLEAMAKERRLVAREAVVIGGVTNVVTTYRQGGELHSVTNPVKVVQSYVSRSRWSKLKIITAAKAAGKWDALKAGIQAAGLEDEWLACQYIEDGDPAFTAATNAVTAAGIATADEIAAFLAGALDN